MTSRLPPRPWGRKRELWWLAVPRLLQQFLPKCLKPEKQAVVSLLELEKALVAAAVAQLVVVVEFRPIG